MSNKLYACSDLHGEYKLWEKIKNFCDNDDQIFFLGDAADRGPDGIKIMQELLNDPRVTYLMGNHEDIFTGYALQWIKKQKLDNFSYWKRQGGYPTMNEFFNLKRNEQIELYKSIIELPHFVIVPNHNGDIINLSHAGFTPNQEPRFKDEFDEQYFFIWNRSHFDQEWTGKDNEYIVHGHTPNRGIMEKYCGGHKFNIDTGAFATGITCLLDLDTFTPTYFTYDEEEKKDATDN